MAGILEEISQDAVIRNNIVEHDGYASSRLTSPWYGGGIVITASAIGLAVLVPATVLAHPLGNFTINHYTGLRIGSDAIALAVVIDPAEIPAFQEPSPRDADGTGGRIKAGVEGMLKAEIHAAEALAAPFEWRFTRADLQRLLQRLAVRGDGPLGAAAWIHYRKSAVQD